MAAEVSTGPPLPVQPPPARGAGTGAFGPATTASTCRQTSSGTVFSSHTASESGTSVIRAAPQGDHAAEAPSATSSAALSPNRVARTRSKAIGRAAPLHVAQHHRARLHAGGLGDRVGEPLAHAGLRELGVPEVVHLALAALVAEEDALAHDHDRVAAAARAPRPRCAGTRPPPTRAARG